MKNIFLYAVLLGFTWASIMAEVSVEAECQAEREAVTDCIENYSNVSRILQFPLLRFKRCPSL